MMSLFFFNDTATTEIYTLSLPAALPILRQRGLRGGDVLGARAGLKTGQMRLRLRQRGAGLEDLHLWVVLIEHGQRVAGLRSEEHKSELQSPCNIVCRLLLEKKKRRARAL